MAYSAVLDWAFCINCVLFGGDSNHNSSKLNCLLKAPFSDWAKATVRFNDHCTRSQFHKIATLRATQFRECMENRRVSIDVMMHSQISEQVRPNREKLIPIVEVVILCGRQNISLRGHRDDLEYLQAALNNPGNLQAILAFLKKCGQNEVFDQHFTLPRRNATYRSKTTKNELINICGEIITETLRKEVKEAKSFLVLADEAADISNKEQMALVLRFIDKNGSIREEFFGFAPCNEGLSGEAISSKIKETISSLGLDMNNCW